jgi:hypothetical protein
MSLDGVYTAVSGTYPVLEGGRDIARNYRSISDPIHGANPRTGFGLSPDRQYFYIMTIDGRQPGYSDGSYDYELAELMLLVGASDAVNMDGGGSTDLVIESSTGFPVRLNKSSAGADSGRERTVGSHLGIFAKPVAGFINDVSVAQQDTSATITWTTVDPASSLIQYDMTQNLTQSTQLDPTLATQHSVLLTGLTPKTGYYFQIVSASATQQYTSPLLYFTTTNYVTTNQLFDLGQPWKFATPDMTSAGWSRPSYDDSNWSGPGPGLFWVDVRPTGPNPDVNPKITQMPFDPSTGYPYYTYYLRTHFNVVNAVPNSSLAFAAYVDDGAVFYLNGTEIYRLRMPTGSITSQTLADSYPCSGDATCQDEFTTLADDLVAGDNVLAVEVHNYNTRSADITFGTSLSLVQPQAQSAQLQVSYANSALTLQWESPGFLLQTAPTLQGPWANVSDGSTSPYVTTASDASRYFRLHK